MTPAAIPPASPFAGAPDAVAWFVLMMMTMLIVGGVWALARAQSRHRWSLSRAMSGPDSKPSASRLIAFLGLLVIATVVLGLGYSATWILLKTGQLPMLTGAAAFLAASSALFTPYLANQIGSALGAPVPPVPTPSPFTPFPVPSPQAPTPSPIPNVLFGPPVPPGS